MKRYLLALGALLLLLAVPSLAAAASFGERAQNMAQVTGVRVGGGTDKTRLVIDSTKPVEYKTLVLSNPTRVVFDLQNAWLAPDAPRELTPNSPYVSRVRIAQNNPETVRVVVETSVGQDGYQVFALAGDESGQNSAASRLVLDFGKVSQASQGAGNTSTAPPSGQVAGNSDNATIALPDVKPRKDTTVPPPKEPTEAEQTAEETAENSPSWSDENASSNDSPAADENQSDTDREIDALTGLVGRKIAIDAGHGGSDSGAIGPTGVTEKSVTLRVALELKRLLEAEGATVYMTRTKDTEVSKKGANATDIEELQARCDVANQQKADIFISIHMDSFTNGTPQGTTGYYYEKGSKASRDLADKVRSGVIDQLGTQSRGTQSCNFYVVKHTDMPATLVELAFISNKDEEKLMNSPEGIKKAAQGIADGIADYFG